jgi:uncharacterized protein
MRLLTWLLGFIAIGYACLVAALYVVQRDILYRPPHKSRIAPTDANFPQADEVVLSTADGEKVIAWHVPPKGEKPVVLFFHGNGDSIELRVPRFREIVSDGTGLLALSFRGYAGSSGQPTEEGLLLDAESAYAFAAARYPSERIVIWGYSLGSGPAVITAAKHPVGKLVLEAPFTSAADVAAAAYPFVPVRLLMKDQYRSEAYIEKLAVPLLVLHGERDRVIGFQMGRRLFDMAPEPKQFIAFPLANHVDLDRYGAVAAVRKFLYGTKDGLVE